MRIALIDNYDSYSMNLMALLERVGVHPLRFLNDALSWEEFQALNVDAVVLSPGPGAPWNARDVGLCAQIIASCLTLPILGVCLGHQLMVHHCGGQIVRSPTPTHGKCSAIHHHGRGLFATLPQGFSAMRYHSLEAARLPPDLQLEAWTEEGTIMAVSHVSRPWQGVQFHPESILTPLGEQLMERFVHSVATHTSHRKAAPTQAKPAEVMPPQATPSQLASSPLVTTAEPAVSAHSGSTPAEPTLAPRATALDPAASVPLPSVAPSGSTPVEPTLASRAPAAEPAAPAFVPPTLYAHAQPLQWPTLVAPTALFERLFLPATHTCFLHFQGERLGRSQSLIVMGLGAQHIRLFSDRLETQSLPDGALQVTVGEPWTLLEQALPTYRIQLSGPADLAFTGGYVGTLSYDMQSHPELQRLAQEQRLKAQSDASTSDAPLSEWLRLESLIVMEPDQQRAFAIAHAAAPAEAESRAQELALRANEALQALMQTQTQTQGEVQIQAQMQMQARAQTQTPAQAPMPMPTSLGAVQPPVSELALSELASSEAAPSQSASSQSQLSDPALSHPAQSDPPRPRPLWSGEEAGTYQAKIHQALALIRAGEAYELCLTQRYCAPALTCAPWTLFGRMMARNPSPYAAFIATESGQRRRIALCTSPETLMTLAGGVIETCPIKGTRRRGLTPAEDTALAEALRHSIKERAENVMVVDVARHDLTHVCDPVSVHVPALFAIKAHPHVWQMVSTVRGTLRAQTSPVQALHALFPPASMTGAPKMRATEHLYRLESTPRGRYAGAYGAIGFDGLWADVAVTIRSVLLESTPQAPTTYRATVGTGGAIVIDSEPAAEWQETQDKVMPLIDICSDTF